MKAIRLVHSVSEVGENTVRQDSACAGYRRDIATSLFFCHCALY